VSKEEAVLCLSGPVRKVLTISAGTKFPADPLRPGAKNRKFCQAKPPAYSSAELAIVRSLPGITQMARFFLHDVTTKHRSASG